MKWLLGLIGLIAIVLVGGYFALKRPDIPYETLAAKYESPASRYVDLPGGIHMHYRDEGAQRATAPTILLIHGFSASLHTWEPLVQRLNDDNANGYRIVSIDLPGHGLTQAPAGYRPSMENLRDAVYAFTQAEHLSRFAIVGNSMGGNVAWEYALAHGDQLDALVLVDAAGWPHTQESEAMDSPMMKLLRSPAGPYLMDLDNTRLFRHGLEQAFADPSRASDAMVTRYSELARAPGHREILLQLQTGRAGRREATNDVLAPIHTPTLIIWGRHDNLIPVADAEQFHAAIHDSDLHVIETSGHLPQEEATEDTATAIHEFLYRIHEGSAVAVSGGD